MTYKERFKKLIDEPFFNYAIFCDTKEKAEKVVQILYELGYKWGNDVPLYKEDGSILSRFEGKRTNKGICYSLNIGSPIIFCSRKEFYEKKMKEIITFDDLFKDCVETNDINEISVEKQEEKNTHPIKQPAKKESVEREIVVKQNNEDDMFFSDENVTTALENAQKTINADNLRKNNESDTKFCENCGKKIKTTAKFCVYCGCKQNIDDLDEIHSNEKSDTLEVSNIKNETSSVKDSDVINKSEINKDAKHSINLETVEDKHRKDCCTQSNRHSEVKQIETKIESKQSTIQKENAVQDKVKSLFLFDILKLKPNQEFQFNNQIFRINKNGIRERKINNTNLWIICNDEQELLCIIQNPECIKVTNNDD